MLYIRQQMSHEHVVQGLSPTLLLYVLAAAYPLPTSANPSGGEVVGGSASIQHSGNLTTIQQHSDKAIINWQDFSIDVNEHTQFIQNNASDVALNRVVGDNLSHIQGKLSATGQVFLVNPNGIVFGSNAIVDVGGLVASTADISNQDFMGGNYQFRGAPADSEIINFGTITVHDAGLVALVAPSVRNNGLIRANMGRVALASGTTFTLDLYGDGLIEFDADEIIEGGLVEVGAEGVIQADGGSIYLTTAAADNILESMINMEGYLQAHSVAEVNGKIVLQGYDNSNIQLAGEIDVSGSDAGEFGGEALVLAGDVTLIEGSLIDASSYEGGGFVETSGYETIDYIGGSVTTRSVMGEFGNWLIDPPAFLTIDNAEAGAIITNLVNTSITSEAGTDVTFTNTTAIDWDPASSTSYTVLAGNDIIINNGGGDVIDASNTSGSVNLRADSDADGSGGVTFTTGSASFGSGDFNIFYNPTGYATPIDYSGDVTGGSGDLTAYMLVNDATDLQAINANNTTKRQDYALGADIDLLSAEFTKIGTSGSPFRGIFNGNGYTISNLKITIGGSDVGLFGYVRGFNAGNMAKIINVAIDGAEISGVDDVGVLVGESRDFAEYSGEFTFSDIDVTTTGVRTGGLIGYVTNNEINTFDDVTVNIDGDITSTRLGTAYIGGVFGYIGNLAEVDGTFNSDVFVDADGHRVGGIAGFANTTAVVSGDFTFENEVVGNQDVGGIFGILNADLSNASLTADGATITGTRDTGGLIGQSSGVVAYSNVDMDVINNTSVTGTRNVGGFVGNFNGTGFTGEHAFSGTVSASDRIVGGMFGFVANNVSMTGVDLTTSGTLTKTGAIGSVGGVFGYIGTGVTIDGDFTSNMTIDSEASQTGGVIGRARTGTTLSGTMTQTAAVEGLDDTGGIIGYLEGELTNATLNYSSATLVGRNDVGGYIGQTTVAADINSTSFSTLTDLDITANNNVGGYFGNLADITLDGTYSYTGDITANDNVGGIVGSANNGSVLSGTFNTTTNITGDDNLGGVVGVLATGSSAAGSLASTNSTVTGNTGGARYLGGVIGQVSASTLSGTFKSIANTIDVTGVLATNTSDAGGVIGSIRGVSTIADDTRLETSGAGSVTGGRNTGGVLGSIATTTATLGSDLYMENNYSVSGGDRNLSGVIGAFSDGDYAVSGTFINNGDVTGGRVGGIVAYIRDNDFSGTLTNTGLLTATGSYVGGIVGQMQGNASLSGTISNSGDISSSGSNVGGIVGIFEDTNVLSGTVSSSGAISGVSNVGGVFGQARDTADFSGTTFSEISNTVTATGSNSGGVSGLLSGAGVVLSADISSTATVSGVDDVGGIFGEVVHTSISSNLTHSGNVSGATDVGGVIGYLNNGDLSGTVTHQGGSVTATGNDVGGLIGEFASSATITGTLSVTESVSASSVSGVSNVGGLIGNVRSNIGTFNPTGTLSNAADVTATGTNVGGIWGLMSESNLTFTQDMINSGNISGASATRVGGIAAISNNNTTYTGTLSNTGNVSGASNVGGIFGLAGSNSTVTGELSNTGYITGSGSLVGGLMGDVQLFTDTLSENMSNTGDVAGVDNVGGLFGRVDRITFTGGLTSSGDVSGVNNVAGLVGFSDDSDFQGAMTYQGGAVNGTGDDVGGLIGELGVSSTITASLAVNESVAAASVSGVNNVGGQFGNVVSTVGTFTPDGSISNAADVIATGDNVGGIWGLMSKSNLTFTQDITNTGNVAGASATQVGGISGIANNNVTYTGVLRNTGNISGAGNVGGLFGVVDSSSTLTGELENTGAITGTGDYVGGLIGDLQIIGDTFAQNMTNSGDVVGVDYVGGLIGSLSNAVLTGELESVGDVTGEDNVGGLIGELDGNSELMEVYYNAEVNGVDNVGGIVGHLGSSSEINDALFGGMVNSTGENAGGIVGLNEGDVNHALSVGEVNGTTDFAAVVGDNQGMVAASFFATEFNDKGIGAGTESGVAAGTESTLVAATLYEAAGWDFVSTWETLAGHYPTLQWCGGSCATMLAPVPPIPSKPDGYVQAVEQTENAYLYDNQVAPTEVQYKDGVLIIIYKLPSSYDGIRVIGSEVRKVLPPSLYESHFVGMNMEEIRIHFTVYKQI